MYMPDQYDCLDDNIMISFSMIDYDIVTSDDCDVSLLLLPTLLGVANSDLTVVSVYTANADIV
jgi:hypothetical protein